MKHRQRSFWRNRGIRSWKGTSAVLPGEIDLIAKEGEYLCFVEVKYRSERETGTPEEAVNAKKQKRISRAALYYLMKQGLGDTTPCRFDVVGIRPDGIRVTKNAFSFKR